MLRGLVMDVLLNQKEVCAAVTLSVTQIWRLEKEGKFPAKVKLGVRRIAWRKSDIEKYIAGL